MELNDGSVLIDFFENHPHRLIHKYMHYFEIYERHFSKFRNKPINMLEFGVSHGGSLQMWKYYFGPQAKIWGVDIDPRCAGLGEENITVMMGDQDDLNSLRSIKNALPKLDIIIDDGGHTFSQQINTFEEFFQRLNDGGIYLCEDIHTSYLPGWSGGYRNPVTFAEYAKLLIDKLYAWYAQDPRLPIDEFTRSAFAIHNYDSVLVIEKRPMPGPYARMQGTPSFPLNAGEQMIYDRG